MDNLDIRKESMIEAGDDPSYQSLVKHSRRSNIVKTLLYSIAFFGLIPMSIAVGLLAGYGFLGIFSPHVPGTQPGDFVEKYCVELFLGVVAWLSTFGLAGLSGHIGEWLLNRQAERHARDETIALIARLARKKE